MARVVSKDMAARFAGDLVKHELDALKEEVLNKLREELDDDDRQQNPGAAGSRHLG